MPSYIRVYIYDAPRLVGTIVSAVGKTSPPRHSGPRKARRALDFVNRSSLPSNHLGELLSCLAVVSPPSGRVATFESTNWGMGLHTAGTTAREVARSSILSVSSSQRRSSAQPWESSCRGCTALWCLDAATLIARMRMRMRTQCSTTRCTPTARTDSRTPWPRPATCFSAACCAQTAHRPRFGLHSCARARHASCGAVSTLISRGRSPS